MRIGFARPFIFIFTVATATLASCVGRDRCCPSWDGRYNVGPVVAVGRPPPAVPPVVRPAVAPGEEFGAPKFRKVHFVNTTRRRVQSASVAVSQTPAPPYLAYMPAIADQTWAPPEWSRVVPIAAGSQIAQVRSLKVRFELDIAASQAVPPEFRCIDPIALDVPVSAAALSYFAECVVILSDFNAAAAPPTVRVEIIGLFDDEENPGFNPQADHDGYVLFPKTAVPLRIVGDCPAP